MGNGDILCLRRFIESHRAHIFCAKSGRAGSLRHLYCITYVAHRHASSLTFLPFRHCTIVSVHVFLPAAHISFLVKFCKHVYEPIRHRACAFWILWEQGMLHCAVQAQCSIRRLYSSTQRLKLLSRSKHCQQRNYAQTTSRPRSKPCDEIFERVSLIPGNGGRPIKPSLERTRVRMN